MQAKDVKKNLLDHSEIKVRLLKLYLDRYLAIIANAGYTDKIRVYDLFCGEGIYENGGEGSPLIILRGVKALHTSGVVRGTIPPIDCVFNDIAEEKVKKVKKVAEEQGLIDENFGQIKFVSVDYEKAVARLITLLPSLKQEKAFVFIDPYGYSKIKAEDIKNLLMPGNTEVLLFLPTQFMYRFDQNGTPESLKDFIGELVEYKKWTVNDSVWHFINQLKDAFRKYLGNEYFVDTFTIQKDANTVFCLFFFSAHIKGFEKMLEAKWEIDKEQGKGWEYNSGGQSLFFAYRMNPLEEALKYFLKEGKTSGAIYEFTLHCGFLPTHAVAVLTAFQDQGKLTVTPADGSKCRKGAFYITYENYRDNPDRVMIKLK